MNPTFQPKQNGDQLTADDINQLRESALTKVDAEIGKSLSANDYTNPDKNKLTNIAFNATANASDAALRDRSTHTGTQTSATIVDLVEAVQDIVGGFLGGAGVTYDDAANTITITGGGGGTFDPEATRDAIGAALVPLGNIGISINDAGDTITISTSATVNSTDAALRDRSTHTGTQSADSIVDGTTNKAYTATEKTKLSGIASGATVNATDANLRDRATHTGVQLSSTISDFTEAVQDTVGSFFVPGTNTTFTYNDAANTIAINAATSGGGIEISATKSAVSNSTNARLVYVTADESNNGDTSLYIHNGTMLKFLQTIAMLLFVFLLRAQTPQVSYTVATVTQMKAYYGNANKIYVSSLNKSYNICSTCTADELTVYAGSGGRKWKVEVDVDRSIDSALNANAYSVGNAKGTGDSLALISANALKMKRVTGSGPVTVTKTSDSLLTWGLNSLDSSKVTGLHSEPYYNTKYAAIGSAGGVSSGISYDTTTAFYFDTLSKRLVVKYGNIRRRFYADDSLTLGGGGGGGGTAQNLLRYSEELDNNSVWFPGSITMTGNTTQAPDGTTTAETGEVTGDFGSLTQTVTVTPNTQYTFSFYAKRGTAPSMQYSVFNATAGADLVARVDYYPQMNSSTFTRISTTFTTPAGCTSIIVYPMRPLTQRGTVFLWGAQLNTGATAGTYTKTTASAIP